jgi:hypothetical protein
MVKNSPTKATNPHVSIVAHVTRDELLRNLNATESSNGFANRFTFFAVQRSKLLPDGGNLTDEAIEPFATKLADAMSFGRSHHLVVRDPNANELWHAEYAELSEGKPGLLGSITARAEAQVMRFALIYAVMTNPVDLRSLQSPSPTITVEHLQAALALWRYSEASARWIFGDTLGDPVADTILAALRRDPAGLTRTEISGLFDRHRKAGEIDVALRSLAGQQLVHRRKEPCEGGRPAERWFAGHGD